MLVRVIITAEMEEMPEPNNLSGAAKFMLAGVTSEVASHVEIVTVMVTGDPILIIPSIMSTEATPLRTLTLELMDRANLTPEERTPIWERFLAGIYRLASGHDE